MPPHLFWRPVFAGEELTWSVPPTELIGLPVARAHQPNAADCRPLWGHLCAIGARLGAGRRGSNRPLERAICFLHRENARSSATACPSLFAG